MKITCIHKKIYMYPKGTIFNKVRIFMQLTRIQFRLYHIIARVTSIAILFDQSNTY